MPEYKTPGVYVEVQKGSPPIEPVGTSTAAFIGVVPDGGPMPIKAPADDSPPVLKWGGAASVALLKAVGVPDATADKLATLQTPAGGFPNEKAFLDAVKAALIAGPAAAVAAGVGAPAGAGGPAVAVAVAPGIAEFEAYKAKFLYAAAEREDVAPVGKPIPLTTFDEFTTKFGLVQKWDRTTPLSNNSVLAHAVFGFFQNGGAKCFVARVTTFGPPGGIGPEVTEALKGLAATEGISLVSAPGAHKEVQDALLEHAEEMKYRFAVLDGKKDAADFQPATATDVKNSRFGAVYFPWIEVANLSLIDPDGPPRVTIPPCGHVAGVYARTDIQQGVHYSPANEPLRGALALKYQLSNAQQGDLNLAGVNVTRNFRGNILVWGARTRASKADAEFKYVSVQRTMSYIAQSIDEGTAFAVFKPNNPKLWEQIKRAVRGFLTIVWQDGALFGNTPDQAFYVKCDEGLNTDATMKLGRVIIEVGVAIVQPAEFVIFRISQKTLGT